jgi:hypothetical protein
MTTYLWVKTINIVITPLFYPLSLLVAIKWDRGQKKLGWILFGILTVLYPIDAIMFWYLIECQ